MFNFKILEAVDNSAIVDVVISWSRRQLLAALVSFQAGELIIATAANHSVDCSPHLDLFWRSVTGLNHGEDGETEAAYV